MSLSSKITDDEMRYFQFKARQLLLSCKEDHEWNEFCKKKTCTCCSCQTSTVTKVCKEVGVQSSPKKPLPFSGRNTKTPYHPSNKELPQTLNEIASKLEKIDRTLSEMKLPIMTETKETTVPKEIFNQQMNVLKFPAKIDAESVKSIIPDRRMQLIQNSLKMSLQRLQSTALRNTTSNFDVKVKKKNTGYLIPRELERQRAAARRVYLASLEKPPIVSKIIPRVASKIVPSATSVKSDAKNDNFKLKSLKAIRKTNLQKSNASNNKKEEVTTLVSSENIAEPKDENIEMAIDAIVDDVLRETVLVINEIRHSKSEKSSNLIQNTKNTDQLFAMPLDSEEHEIAMNEQLRSKLEKIRQNLLCFNTRTEPKNINDDSKQDLEEIKSLTKMIKNATHNEQLCSIISSQPKSLGDCKKMQPLRELIINPVQAKQIAKCRKNYWNYLEQISRTRKRNFDPWVLLNMVAESLLDDCIKEVSEDFQDVAVSLIPCLYDQEFLPFIY